MTNKTNLAHGISPWAMGIAFFLVAGISVVMLPWPKKEISIGYFKISTNQYGSAIYQDGLHRSIQCTGCTAKQLEKNTISFSSDTQPMELTYSRDDIIWDSQGNLYTEPKDSEVQAISQKTGIVFTKLVNDDRQIHTVLSQLTILNPNNPGLISITFPENTPVSINRETKIIQVFAPVVPMLVIDTY